jgi:hypothetical protein
MTKKVRQKNRGRKSDDRKSAAGKVRQKKCGKKITAGKVRQKNRGRKIAAGKSWQEKCGKFRACCRMVLEEDLLKYIVSALSLNYWHILWCIVKESC